MAEGLSGAAQLAGLVEDRRGADCGDYIRADAGLETRITAGQETGGTTGLPPQRIQIIRRGPRGARRSLSKSFLRSRRPTKTSSVVSQAGPRLALLRCCTRRTIRL